MRDRKEARVGKIFGEGFFINVVIFEAVEADEVTHQWVRTETWGDVSMLGADGVVAGGRDWVY